MLYICTEKLSECHLTDFFNRQIELQKARNVQQITTTTDKSALAEAIFVERRKELLGEGGGDMLDYLRLQKPLVRESDQNPFRGQ